MQARYFDLNTYFRRHFGERVHKLTVDAGLSCPNRDGRIGRGGCIYCNSRGSGTGAHQKGLSITRQLEINKAAVARRFRAGKFLAYFQSFSNTYAPLSHLKQLYDEALAVPDIVGLAIGTRPDCINPGVLDLLQGYAHDRLIWVEYGLQSAHDSTLARIHRGHDKACFEAAVRATAGRGLRICAHIILGLPGETPAHMRATADFLASLPIDGVKLHLLYVVKGTPLADIYRRGEYQCLEQAGYADLVCDVLERLPSGVVIQRLTGDPHRDELIAPLWALDKQKTLNLVKQRLVDRETWQGRLFDAPKR